MDRRPRLSEQSHPTVSGKPQAPRPHPSIPIHLQCSDLLLDCCDLLVCRIAIIESGEVGGLKVSVVGDQGAEVQGVKSGSLGSRGDRVGQSEEETSAPRSRGQDRSPEGGRG